ncbi:putative transporter [Wickerhamomyces ciferrii]|uniref:Transporter n=1 Tax=Wickerhamomyces ciferrii (strain ATCC 14091 / BCRC 22168 / CBS 111 / JCM 3599 / NBRC 0793 / NRRL Y-1031 F-60-10) TaxID=1206466 RepID=K0KE74_WICCF|nr:putative transporter [Wickerhamomyces ciferrii]CCH43405.1 putative transporter [Wickerhamomyces ciferrii]
MSDLESNKEKLHITLEKIDTLNSNKAHVNGSEADTTLKFINQHAHLVTTPLTPESEQRIRWKLFIWLVPLLMLINTILFLDKSALSYGVLLGLFQDVNITTDQYNNLNSIFYTGYLLGQIPMHFILQRLNFGKFISITLFIWCILTFLTVLASNYGGLIVLRFLLGFFESIVLPALEITLLQFFNAKERAMINPIFWTTCVGPSVWIGGFISYGLLHLESSISNWKIFLIIIGGLTLLTSILSWFIYPSNPAEAKFLTIEERVLLINKIQNQSNSSIEQKKVKPYQIKECFKDPISWLFLAFALTSMIMNNIMFQANILYESLGVSNLGSTLVNVAGGGFATLYLIGGVIFIYKVKNSTAWIILIGAIPGLAGSIGMVTIPYDKKLALVACLVLAGNTFALSFIAAVGWSTSTASGYTKKFYRNIMFMFGYCIANIISPQIWKGNQAPRYYPAWGIQIVISFFIPVVIGFIIHIILQKRNQERLKFIKENPDSKFGQVIINDLETGEEIIEKVEIANLDLTDLENKTFIYPL